LISPVRKFINPIYILLSIMDLKGIIVLQITIDIAVNEAH